MRRLLLLGLALPLACSPAEEEGQGSAMTQDALTSYRAQFVDSASCATCHDEHVQRWSGSDHDLAMQTADDQTVLADFDGTEFTSADRTTRFAMRDGEFFVTAEGPDGADHEYRVLYCFGVDPLQQYLVDFPGGRLQCLDIAWDVQRGEWFDLNEGREIPAGDAYHWTGRFQSWNLQCADCHSTFFEKNYDAATDTYASEWREINVGCQACHGPGKSHNELAASWDGARPADAITGFEVDLRRDGPAEILNSCAPCHSRRGATTPSHRIGAPFDDDYRLSLLDADLYYPDGQVQAEVYVHGSFLQSKMHTAGVSCVDCHDPHSLELWLAGNATCLQCHSPEPPLDRFATLEARAYDSPEHHFHEQGSTGAQCVNCHMPETTYMVIDPRRDHSLRIPRPDLTLTLGSPNACNGCHEDQTAQWAADQIREWYGHGPARHYGQALGINDASPQEDINALIGLPFDPEAPSIVKASALDRLPAGTPVAMQTAAALLAQDDLDVQMRAAALRTLRGSDPQVLLAFVAPLLEDESRRVRIEAAECLAGEVEAQLSPEQLVAFEAALAEFEASQASNADAPFSHLNLAVIQDRRGRVREATASYRKALELDPGFLPAVFNLATLLSTSGDSQGARTILSQAIEQFPEEGELHYSLGLLLAGMGDSKGSSDALVQAGKRMPNRPRVQYNLGLALAQVDQRDDAETALLRASRLAPEDADYVYALATFYMDGEQLELARDWAGRLVKLVPQAPGPLELVKEIEERMAAEK